jgi:D-3-phosphoglycerate dehydrogenase / 2-oxoglutarate reductase
MAFLMYDDIPGVIGRVGTLFGAAEVNIANMTVSRNRAGGKALMALSIDSHAPDELVAQLREGMDEAYLID